MCMASINIIFQRVVKTDPISKGIHILLVYFFFFFIDVRFLAQQASFLTVGAIAASQMRGFLLFVMNLFHSMASETTSNLFILLLAEVMGMYFMSSVLLLRMNLPLQYRRIITEVLGDIEFHFYHQWADLIFIFSSLFTIIVFFFSRQTSSSKPGGGGNSVFGGGIGIGGRGHPTHHLMQKVT
eukprot:TRINITY_DN51386_c0_g1_i1.p2 TRINITY_DN51386_c0_g1~~TRINITY_DN51386_c0_g1_i1.p2  ORF type:complete len:199 (-),score=90.46 TRINITY_DN51386_c0_g1_i1:48-596(-)